MQCVQVFFPLQVKWLQELRAKENWIDKNKKNKWANEQRCTHHFTVNNENEVCHTLHALDRNEQAIQQISDVAPFAVSIAAASKKLNEHEITMLSLHSMLILLN